MFSPKFKIAIVEEVFSEPDASFHDTIWEVLDISVPSSELKMVFMALPEGIQISALEWGLNDTVFNDNVFYELEKNKKAYKHQINELIEGIKK